MNYFLSEYTSNKNNVINVKKKNKQTRIFLTMITQLKVCPRILSFSKAKYIQDQAFIFTHRGRLWREERKLQVRVHQHTHARKKKKKRENSCLLPYKR